MSFRLSPLSNISQIACGLYFPLSLLSLLTYLSEAKDGYNTPYYCYVKERFETEQKSFISVSLERNHKLLVKVPFFSTSTSLSQTHGCPGRFSIL